VLTACTEAEMPTARLIPIESVSNQIQLRYEDFSRQGFRTLGLAYKPMDSKARIDKTDEAGMRFLGFLLFFDRPKRTAPRRSSNCVNWVCDTQNHYRRQSFGSGHRQQATGFGGTRNPDRPGNSENERSCIDK